jgi:hypothetical protein
MRSIIERLGTLQQPGQSPLLNGGGLHTRLARWLVGPYVNASNAFWYDYMQQQHIILQDLSRLVMGLSPNTGPQQVWDDRSTQPLGFDVDNG